MFDWIVGFVEGGGLLGIGLLMLAETVFPPIPSELVMPLAGFVAARGEIGLAAAVLAGSAGSLTGATLWYFIGRRVGSARLRRWTTRWGRWLTLSPDEVDQATAWFRRHGGLAVLIGRMVPGVRSLISVPAGVVEMPLGRFLAFSALGTLGWTALLTTAGYILGENYRSVAGWLDPIAYAVVGLALATYLYRVVTFRPQPDPPRQPR